MAGMSQPLASTIPLKMTAPAPARTIPFAPWYACAAPNATDTITTAAATPAYEATTQVRKPRYNSSSQHPAVQTVA